jgi:hypothetical protein
MAGTDAHGNTYRLGPLRRAVLPYKHCFQAVRTHILSPAPFAGELEHDLAVVYQSLRAGNCFVAYDAIGDSKGFRFTGLSGEISAGMGEEISLSRRVDFTVSSPLKADLRLLRDGQVVARGILHFGAWHLPCGGLPQTPAQEPRLGVHQPHLRATLVVPQN